MLSSTARATTATVPREDASVAASASARSPGEGVMVRALQVFYARVDPGKASKAASVAEAVEYDLAAVAYGLRQRYCTPLYAPLVDAFERQVGLGEPSPPPAGLVAAVERFFQEVDPSRAGDAAYVVEVNAGRPDAVLEWLRAQYSTSLYRGVLERLQRQTRNEGEKRQARKEAADGSDQEDDDGPRAEAREKKTKKKEAGIKVISPKKRVLRQDDDGEDAVEDEDEEEGDDDDDNDNNEEQESKHMTIYYEGELREVTQADLRELPKEKFVGAVLNRMRKWTEELRDELRGRHPKHPVRARWRSRAGLRPAGVLCYGPRTCIPTVRSLMQILETEFEENDEGGNKHSSHSHPPQVRTQSSSEDKKVDDHDDHDHDDDDDSSNSHYVMEIPRFDMAELGPGDMQWMLRELPIFFVRGLVNVMDPCAFDPQNLAREHGDDLVDVVIQDPDSTGFSIAAHAMVKMTVSEFVAYMRDFQAHIEDVPLVKIEECVMSRMKGVQSTGRVAQFVSDACVDRAAKLKPQTWRRSTKMTMFSATTTTSIPTTAPPLLLSSSSSSSVPESDAAPQPQAPAPPPRKRPVLFCVNVDVGTWDTVVHELEKLPNWCKWGAADTLLRHMPAEVPGLSLPQLYLKVPGVWTGGHEENLRFHSINNNHGPGVSMWGAIAHEHTAKLRKAVLSASGVDIYRNEGRWFPSAEFCRKHHIPVMFGVQRPGDTAILNGATLHWVRSGGIAVNSSWNFGVRCAQTMALAYDRHATNVGLAMQNLVPVRALSLNVLLDARKNANSNTTSSDEEREFLRYCYDQLAVCCEAEKANRAVVEKEWGGDGSSNSAAPHFPVSAEPPGMLILTCEQCYVEVLDLYALCHSCVEHNVADGTNEDASRARPVYFCVRCGLRHARRYEEHDVQMFHKVFDEETTQQEQEQEQESVPPQALEDGEVRVDVDPPPRAFKVFPTLMEELRGIVMAGNDEPPPHDAQMD